MDGRTACFPNSYLKKKNKSILAIPSNKSSLKIKVMSKKQSKITEISNNKITEISSNNFDKENINDTLNKL